MIDVGIVTVSDSCANGTREDVSGPAIAAHCATLGWTVVRTAVVPDEEAAIAAVLREWADLHTLPLILTTGGTGIARRDVTPEATRSSIQREIPGLPEMMRMAGLQHTRRAALARGIAGCRGKTLIINLPGSPAGALQSLEAIQDLIPHATDLLKGKTEHSETL